jgi:thioredoxin 1
MVPIVTNLASDFGGRALVGTVNTTEQPGLVSSYSIVAVPTFIFFKHGQEVSRQRGQTTYEDLAGKLDALLSSP